MTTLSKGHYGRSSEQKTAAKTHVADNEADNVADNKADNAADNVADNAYFEGCWTRKGCLI